MKKICFNYFYKVLFLGLFFSVAVLFSGVQSEANSKNIAIGINKSGETYGSALYCSESLDLISAKATNGNIGYIRNEDLEKDSPSSPSEALNSINKDRIIPVYKNDGQTIIGYFVIESGNTSTPLLTRSKATSSVYEFSVDGSSYSNQSTVYVHNTSSPYVESRAKVSASRTVDAGWLGTSPQLYDEAGHLIATSSFRYNSSACVSYETIVTYNTNTGTYYACGKTKVWSSTANKYHTISTYASPNQNF